MDVNNKTPLQIAVCRLIQLMGKSALSQLCDTSISKISSWERGSEPPLHMRRLLLELEKNNIKSTG